MGCWIHLYKKWKNGYGKTTLKVCKRCGEMLYWGTIKAKFCLNNSFTGWIYCKSVKEFEKKIVELKLNIPNQIKNLKIRKDNKLRKKQERKDKRERIKSELKKSGLI